MYRSAVLFAVGLIACTTASASAQTASIDVAAARASTIGHWEGSLEYRDYSADRWFGIPVTTTISDAGDTVTLLRVSDFDDGPEKGMVRITSMSLLGEDGTTEYATSFRKSRLPELDRSTLSITSAADVQNWVMVSMRDGRDNNRPALIRETTTRAGNQMVTLKEVDFSDDQRTEWLMRNRTALTLRQAGL